MKCACGGETRVKDSRPDKRDPKVIVRRRECEKCGDRFNTWEGTLDPVKRRESNRKSLRARYHAMSPEEKAAKRSRSRDSHRVGNEVWKEAHERGVSTKLVRSEWGLGRNRV